MLMVARTGKNHLLLSLRTSRLSRNSRSTHYQGLGQAISWRTVYIIEYVRTLVVVGGIAGAILGLPINSAIAWSHCVPRVVIQQLSEWCCVQKELNAAVGTHCSSSLPTHIFGLGMSTTWFLSISPSVNSRLSCTLPLSLRPPSNLGSPHALPPFSASPSRVVLI